ncbi:glycosyltransferase [Synechococcus sp. CBW1107]|uniref:glycosyltransferase family 4 protein n=1 Tax=Synechococcus sp. CBW1107 TaxID=2789857 RepID=UPI002AD386A1|nr:glycosyltransferase [Synechococcus sp. CBW1107]CAK6687009.1 hypothetical protein ICNINCKA_00116 [Synechococcus sp. CBW1107]
MKQCLAVHFARFGPYHHARLGSAISCLEPMGWNVVGLETANSDDTYGWATTSQRNDPSYLTVFPGDTAERISSSKIKQGFNRTLSDLRPSVVAIAGWASLDAMACVNWCKHNGAYPILMSETRAADGQRRWWKEAIKARRLSSFSGALVGGKSHEAYLRHLGFSGPVSHGYDVVDNAYFRQEASRWRGNELCSRPYLLASSRFVARKNLCRLIQSFANAVSSKDLQCKPPLDLCLLGDGSDRDALLAACESHNLSVVMAAPWNPQAMASSSRSSRVLFPGFRQIEELPRFYAHAAAFVHPAESEPWGLVINEAMASGLPVLCSTNGGSAEELVVEGVNGYLFNPLDTCSITNVLCKFIQIDQTARTGMGDASFSLIEQRCPTSAFGQGLARLLAQLG